MGGQEKGEQISIQNTCVYCFIAILHYVCSDDLSTLVNSSYPEFNQAKGVRR